MNSSYVAPEWYMAVSFLAIGCYLVIPTSEAEGESVYLCKTPHLNEHNVVGQGDCFTARILTGLSGDCAGVPVRVHKCDSEVGGGRERARPGHTSLYKHGFENQTFLQSSQLQGSVLLERGFEADH